ncbi:hypothetical protein M1146_06155 [Patescibacteria group bacterium]|nr:hypothetical protein [Patescibacteria group bacterium]
MFEYALSITLSLIKYFRHVLKVMFFHFIVLLLQEEIRVFLSIFLRILESNNSSIQQKSAVVDFIHKICQNPQILCDIFVNYDCDLDHGDVFDSIVNRISKIVTLGTVRSTKEGAEEGLSIFGTKLTHLEDPLVGLQKLGLQALVSILNSIVDWSAELYEPPKQPEALRSYPSIAGGSNSEQEDQMIADTPAREEETILDPAERMAENDQWQQNKERKLLMDAGKKIFALKAKKVGGED